MFINTFNFFFIYCQNNKLQAKLLFFCKFSSNTMYLFAETKLFYLQTNPAGFTINLLNQLNHALCIIVYMPSLFWSFQFLRHSRDFTSSLLMPQRQMNAWMHPLLHFLPKTSFYVSTRSSTILLLKLYSFHFRPNSADRSP